MVKRFLIQIIFRQYSKEGYVLFCLFVVGLLLLISFNLFSFFGEQHFVLLAKSLLRGEASLGKGIVTTDGSYFNGFTFGHKVYCQQFCLLHLSVCRPVFIKGTYSLFSILLIWFCCIRLQCVLRKEDLLLCG